MTNSSHLVMALTGLNIFSIFTAREAVWPDIWSGCLARNRISGKIRILNTGRMLDKWPKTRSDTGLMEKYPFTVHLDTDQPHWYYDQGDGVCKVNSINRLLSLWNVNRWD